VSALRLLPDVHLFPNPLYCIRVVVGGCRWMNHRISPHGCMREVHWWRQSLGNQGLPLLFFGAFQHPSTHTTISETQQRYNILYAHTYLGALIAMRWVKGRPKMFAVCFSSPRLAL
jgi:hypothetical protein